MGKQDLTKLADSASMVVPVGSIRPLYRPAVGTGKGASVYDASVFTTPVNNNYSIADTGYLLKNGNSSFNGPFSTDVIVRLKCTETKKVTFGYWSGATFVAVAPYTLTAGLPEEFYLPAGWDVRNIDNSATITLSLLILE